MSRLLAVVVLLFGLGVAAVPADATGCSAPHGVYTGATPWAQRLIDAPRIWPLSTGSGVLVAVVGTGVDAANAQFAPGQVLPQINLLSGGPADCDGRGTFAAGIVAARTNPDTTFAGIAPGAHILPIRYTQSTSDSTQGADPNALATAINRAVDAHAGVILVVVPAGTDSAALRSAVRDATAAGDVVVAPAVATQAGLRSYPTATAGVLGVGAVDSAGAAVQTEAGGYVALAAPGADLVSTSAGAQGKLGMTWPVRDPSFAAAYAAGVVALLRSYLPALPPNQIVNRLTVTASRPAGGGHDGKLGWGVLDAYAAVSAALPAVIPGPGATVRRAILKPVSGATASAATGSPYRWAGVVAILAVLLAGLVVFGAATVRRGRARGWRLGRHGTTAQ
ncbi:MAG TPA: S8 family serine peptidase [Pseudonocardiaceae bacterium]|nr:S8 family serine peptidase [Pseudonocardiaceae bacterium]